MKPFEKGNTVGETHGHWKNGKPSPTYISWIGMKTRCNNPKSSDYKDYGERGIAICEDWKFSFENFLKDMGKRPEGMTLDRKDPDGDYEPDNCQWADRKYQRKNQRKRDTYTNQFGTFPRRK